MALFFLIFVFLSVFFDRPPAEVFFYYYFFVQLGRQRWSSTWLVCSEKRDRSQTKMFVICTKIVHKHLPTSHRQEIVIESDNRSVYETLQSMKRYFRLYDTGVTSLTPPSLCMDCRESSVFMRPYTLGLDVLIINRQTLALRVLQYTLICRIIYLIERVRR